MYTVRAMPRSPIRILCSADAAYAPWVGVMLASVLRFEHGAALHIHLLSDGIDAPTLRRLAAMAQDRHAGFSVHDAAPLLAARPDRRALATHVSRATYGRLHCADLLPPEADRVVHLDVDTLCRGTLRELWEIDLGDAPAAAVRDCAIGVDPVGDLAAAARMERDQHADRLRLPRDGSYFNAGVMLIDMARWRAEGIGTAAAAWTEANRQVGVLEDQDGLNCVLHGRIVWLDDRWNWLAGWAWREPTDDIRIVHYAGPDKPWHAGYQGKGAAEWLAAKAASPFRDAPLANGEPHVAWGFTGRTYSPSLLATQGDALCLRLRPTGGARTETLDGAEVIGNDPDRSDVFVFGPHVGLPPGAYMVALHLALLQDVAPSDTGARKLIRFQIGHLHGTRTIAMLEFAVPPHVALRDMPVTLDFVLPGPALDIECWLQASPGVCAKLRADIVITRKRDRWRRALCAS